MMTIDLANIEQSLLLVGQKLDALMPPLDSELHYKATFVSEEILSNLARHANFKNKTPDVVLMWDTTEEKALLLTFKDNADAFNMLEFPDPKIGGDLEEVALGGLGIYLTKQYAQNIQYCYKDDYNILKVLL